MKKYSCDHCDKTCLPVMRLVRLVWLYYTLVILTGTQVRDCSDVVDRNTTDDVNDTTQRLFFISVFTVRTQTCFFFFNFRSDWILAYCSTLEFWDFAEDVLIIFLLVHVAIDDFWFLSGWYWFCRYLSLCLRTRSFPVMCRSQFLLLESVCCRRIVFNKFWNRSHPRENGKWTMTKIKLTTCLVIRYPMWIFDKTTSWVSDKNVITVDIVPVNFRGDVIQRSTSFHRLAEGADECMLLDSWALCVMTTIINHSVAALISEFDQWRGVMQHSSGRGRTYAAGQWDLREKMKSPNHGDFDQVVSAERRSLESLTGCVFDSEWRDISYFATLITIMWRWNPFQSVNIVFYWADWADTSYWLRFFQSSCQNLIIPWKLRIRTRLVICNCCRWFSQSRRVQDGLKYCDCKEEISIVSRFVFSEQGVSEYPQTWQSHFQYELLDIQLYISTIVRVSVERSNKIIVSWDQGNPSNWDHAISTWWTTICWRHHLKCLLTRFVMSHRVWLLVCFCARVFLNHALVGSKLVRDFSDVVTLWMSGC